jgi:hypothetical protein
LEKLIQTIENWQKQKKIVPNTKTCVQMWQSIFSYQKKWCISQKNCNFLLWEKGICEEKSSFIFLRILTHNFERIHHETNWSDSGLGGLFYFILFLIWWHPLKILLIFNSLYIYIYMCIPLGWMDERMTGQMDEMMFHDVLYYM